jgi:hypothetical protein
MIGLAIQFVVLVTGSALIALLLAIAILGDKQ